MPIRVLSLDQHTEEHRPTPDGGVLVRRWKDLDARLGSMDYLTLQPGGQPLRLFYPESEDSYYVVHGRGVVADLQRGEEVPFGEGQFVHVPAGLPHQLQAAGGRPLVLLGGPCPPALNAFDRDSPLPVAGSISVLDLSSGVDIPLVRPPMPGGFARFPVWPAMGAQLRSMNCVVMRPGQENVPHVHPVSEDIFYCLSGTCTIQDGDSGRDLPFSGGCLIFVDPGTTHAVRSFGPDDYVSVGGPCPPDLAIFRRFGLLP